MLISILFTKLLGRLEIVGKYSIITILRIQILKIYTKFNMN